MPSDRTGLRDYYIRQMRADLAAKKATAATAGRCSHGVSPERCAMCRETQPADHRPNPSAEQSGESEESDHA